MGAAGSVVGTEGAGVEHDDGLCLPGAHVLGEAAKNRERM